MLHQLITYIKWLPKTFHLHGIHSPFVFSFEKKCLKRTSSKEIISKLADYRHALLQSDKTISVTDFGAGSRVFTSNERAIKDIARYAGAPLQRMQLIKRIVDYIQPKNILEIGTSLGMGTIALAANPESIVTSLEGCPETAAVAQQHLKDFTISNAHIIIGEFGESLQKIATNKFDLIYFDGNHSKEATLNYAQEMLSSTTNETVWIFDDIYWSPEMTEAWQTLKKLPKVTVTIDCFYVGFLFFRKEQQKEDFFIKL